MSHLVLIKKIFLPPLFSVKMQPFSFFHEFVWLKLIFRDIFSSDVTKKEKKKTPSKGHTCVST